MAKPGGPRLRRLLRDIHLWIGLSLFLVLAPLGLTGSLLVWDDAVDRMVHPARYAVSPGELAPSAYEAQAARAFEGRATLSQLRLPARPGDPVVATGLVGAAARPGGRAPSLAAWIDPGTGKVLGVGDPRRELRGFIHRLHGELLLPQGGRAVVGWLGVAMLALSVSGLVVWWPRGGGVGRALAWRRSPSTLSNLHHQVGFWLCVPLAVLSLTGAWIAFPQVTRALTASTPGGGPEPATPGRGGPRPGRGRPGQAAEPPAARPAIGIDGAVARALAEAGGQGRVQGRVLSITEPGAGQGAAWRIQVSAPGGARLEVRVDPASGRARAQPAAAGGPGGPGADPVMRAMRRVHEGAGLGPAWRWIVTLTGLAPTVLGVSGAALWLVRGTRRARLGA